MGVDNSPEKNLGIIHVHLLTFEDVAARDASFRIPTQEIRPTSGQVGVVTDAFVVDDVPLNFLLDSVGGALYSFVIPASFWSKR